jgi:hypothetical protein
MKKTLSVSKRPNPQNENRPNFVKMARFKVRLS